MHQCIDRAFICTYINPADTRYWLLTVWVALLFGCLFYMYLLFRLSPLGKQEGSNMQVLEMVNENLPPQWDFYPVLFKMENDCHLACWTPFGTWNQIIWWMGTFAEEATLSQLLLRPLSVWVYFVRKEFAFLSTLIGKNSFGRKNLLPKQNSFLSEKSPLQKMPQENGEKKSANWISVFMIKVKKVKR